MIIVSRWTLFSPTKKKLKFKIKPDLSNATRNLFLVVVVLFFDFFRVLLSHTQNNADPTNKRSHLLWIRHEIVVALFCIYTITLGWCYARIAYQNKCPNNKIVKHFSNNKNKSVSFFFYRSWVSVSVSFSFFLVLLFLFLSLFRFLFVLFL